MARDRFLKVKCWVVHMYQERGVDLLNQHLEWHWGGQCEKNQET